jgi:O-antigen ligase
MATSSLPRDRVGAWLQAAFGALPLVSVLSALVLLVLGVRAAFTRRPKLLPLPTKSFSLLVLLVASAAALSVTPTVSWAAPILFAAYFLVVWALGRYIDRPARLWAIVANVFWGAVVSSVVGIAIAMAHLHVDTQILGLLIRLGTPDDRVASVFYHPNIFSGYLLLATGLGLMLLLQRRHLARAAVAAGLAVVLLAQLMTSCRSGWIGTLVLGLLIGVLLDRRALAWMTLGGGIGVSACWSMVLPRLQTLLEPRFGSNLHRRMVWESACQMIAARPWFGWGPGSWSVAYPRFENPEIVEVMPHAHNLYLMIGAEYGLFVLVALVGTFVSLVVKAILETRHGRWSRHVTILGCTIVGYLVLGAFDFILTEGRNSILFFSMMGLLVGMRRMARAERPGTGTICFVSNGPGEDEVAAAIARSWPRRGYRLRAFPLEGPGLAYHRAGLPVVAPLRPEPGEGLTPYSRASFIRPPGALVRNWEQFRALRKLRGSFDLAVIVGDVHPLLLAHLADIPFVFVSRGESDPDRTGLTIPFRWLDRLLLRHPRCRAVYPRDPAMVPTGAPGNSGHIAAHAASLATPIED